MSVVPIVPIHLLALVLLVHGVGLLVGAALLLATVLLGVALLIAVRRKTEDTFGAAAELVRRPGSELGWHEPQVTRIRVNHGYEPAEVHVAADTPVRLIFRREEIAGDSERVVFPDLGLSAELPSFTDVAVELPAGDPGEREFMCPTRALRGALVVEARPGGPAAVNGERSAHGLASLRLEGAAGPCGRHREPTH
jgi:hypothetical protein